MATAKKSTTKKPTAKRTVAQKTTTTKRAVTAKPTAKKVAAVKKTTVSAKSKKSAEFESFHLGKEKTPFMTFRITDQTIYWSILLIYIMLLVLWISNIQLETLRIIENIKIS